MFVDDQFAELVNNDMFFDMVAEDEKGERKEMFLYYQLIFFGLELVFDSSGIFQKRKRHVDLVVFICLDFDFEEMC